MTAEAVVSRETGPARAKPNGKPSLAAEPLTRTIVSIGLEQIDIGPNVRVNVEAIDELAASIKTHGVLQPIKVRAAGDRWVVMWGQRRVLAARKAGLERIPAITTRDEPTPEQLAAEQLVENLHRADLAPLDRARAMRAVVDSGVSQADLARELGLAPSTIANDLGLLEAPAKIQEAIQSGEISPAHARAMKGLAPKTQAELVKEVVDRGYSAHRTEQEVQERKRRADLDREREQREAKDRDARSAQLTASLATEIAKKKVPLDELVVLDAGYGGDTQHAFVVGILRAAGLARARVAKNWNEISARPSGGLCDCNAWRAAEHVSYAWAKTGETRTYRISLTKGCIDRKHEQAKAAIAETKRQAKAATQERVSAHVSANAAAWASFATGAIAIQRILAEAALFSLLSYRLPEWSIAHGGHRTNPWQTIHGLTDEVLAIELAKAIAADFRDHAGYHVDWATLATELGLAEQPEA